MFLIDLYVVSEMSFENKVILITGASSGIGAACAEYFAKHGASLALVGRNAKKFENVTGKIKASGVEKEPLIILADVSTDAEHIISATVEKYGRLDVLINNAGFAARGTIEDSKMEDFDSMMATNVRGVLELTQLAMPHLILVKGNVVNVSSCGSLRAYPGFLAYSMTKAALDQFTKCVALELAEKGVRVNCVNPGFVDTDFHYRVGYSQEEYPAALEGFAKMHPIGRAGVPDDVVNAVAFLASDDSDFVTGVCLPVDGGIVLK